MAPAKVEPVDQTPPPVVKPPVAAKPGFFGWLKGLFGGEPSATPAVVPAAPTGMTKDDKRERPDGRSAREAGRRGEPRPDRAPRGEGRAPRSDGRNSGRNGNRGERGGERGNNPRERSEIQATQAMDVNANLAPESGTGNAGEANRAERSNRNGERGERGERSNRGERRPARQPGNSPAPAQTSQEDAAQGEEALAAGAEAGSNSVQGNAAPREKRARDRYGRERKPRGERTDSTSVAIVASEGAATQDDDAPRKSYFTQAASAQASDLLAVQAPTIAQATDLSAAATAADLPHATVAHDAPDVTAQVAADLPTSQATAAPLTVRPQEQAVNTGMPAVPAYQLPLEQLAEIAQQSGLVWVNSDAEKIAAAQAAIAAEPKPVHVARERAPVVVLDDRPLVLVETRLDLRDIKLPFEETQAA
jgi:ribonuclease E